MSFNHICFISYRNIDRVFYKRVLEKIYMALVEEFEYCEPLDELVFLDREGIQAGNDHNPIIAEALCRSAFMILFYAPRYFQSSYCCREYLAMKELEERRLKYIRSERRRYCGMIIPLIYREYAYDENLKDLMKARQCFVLNPISEVQINEMEAKIRTLAQNVIIPRYKELSKYLPIDLFDHCNGYKLPDDNAPETQSLILKSKQPFPI